MIPAGNEQPRTRCGGLRRRGPRHGGLRAAGTVAGLVAAIAASLALASGAGPAPGQSSLLDGLAVPQTVAAAAPSAIGPALGPATNPAVPPPSLTEALAQGRRLRADLAAASETHQDPDPLAEIDACMTQEMAATDTPGASIAVSVNGEIVLAQGYGVKREGTDEAVDQDTLFRIGSTTKMMTAAGVMQQVELDRVDLSEPLATYIDDWDVNGAWDAPEVTGADVTPWHLLTHTSAYPDRLFLDTPIDGPKGPTALGDWARLGVSVTLHAPPGSFWNYSNPGFSLAGLVVERASGVSYPEYMRDMVWGPAGMDTTFLLPDDVLAYGNYTHGHRWVDQATGAEIVYGPADYDNWAAAPAGYAFSRPTDMVRWANLLMAGGGDVLTSESVEAMLAPQTPMDIVPGQDYGYGIFRTVDPSLDRVIFDHGGNIPGWSSQLYWSPADGLAVSVLANTMRSLAGSAGCALLAMMGEEPGESPDYDTDPATWDHYLGSYRGLDVTGAELAVVVTRGTTDTLVATFPQIELAPGMPYTSTLSQAALDTFLIDTDADGLPNDTITFIAHPDHPGAAYWLRNRAFVLTMQQEPPPVWRAFLPWAHSPVPARTSAQRVAQ